MNVEISEIQIIPVRPREGLLAFCSFVINNSFYVGNIAIYSCLNKVGYRLVYPVKVLPNGKPVSCFHPINKKVGEFIEGTVITKYEELIKKLKRGDENDKFRRETSY